MAILSLGISHRSAAVELLDRLAFTEDDLVKAYRRAADDLAIEEAVIVSTCNRVEVYGSVPSYHAGFQALKRLVVETRGIAAEELSQPLYAHYELEAAEHVFSVASGLDSMVLGEPQILSQVRDSLRRAESEGAAGPALGALFQAATHTGRRVRTETGVGAAPDAFVRAGADLGALALGGLDGRHAVVVGAGQMAALAVKHLRGRGVATVRILNRSLERARSLAERTGADHGELEALPDALAEADLLVSATGAAGVIVPASALQGRERPLFVLDLAVPRDVDAAAREMTNVTLADIDDLREALNEHAAETAADIERAHAIVAEELERFTLRRRAEHLAPIISALLRRGDQVVAAELERFRSGLAGLEPQEREAVEALVRGVVAKLLHDPIVRLKGSAPGAQDEHARALSDLFGLEPPSSNPD